jgi:hypothetical protein
MKKLLGLLLIVLSLFSCEEDAPVVSGDEGLSLPARVNAFIVSSVEDAYLWTSTVRWDLVDADEGVDPFDLFAELVYTDEDRWSELTDDMVSFEESFTGVSSTFGYRLQFYLMSEGSDEVIAVVLFVYPGGPADRAGIERGDIFVRINGASITTSNYRDLYYGGVIRLTEGYLISIGNESTIIADDVEIPLSAVLMYEDPVIKDTVIDRGSSRIGYLCYTDYMVESESKLLEVFSDFRSAGVTDVVLDLRYNGGGYARTSVFLSSILAPAEVVGRKEIFLSQVWNASYTAYFAERGESLSERFTDTLLSVNMNLSRIYILTGGNTASASESTIIGLSDYMEVILIGDTTHGKYCGGVLLSPEVYDQRTNAWYPDVDIANWGMYLMVYRFSSASHPSAFPAGLAPIHYIPESDHSLYPFGNPRDPLLAKALELITGEVQPSSRVAAPALGSAYRALPFPYRLRVTDGRLIDDRVRLRREIP